MADAQDPFTPGQISDPTAGIPNPDQYDAIKGQWATFMQKPGAMTYLAQVGNALATPQWGNRMSQISGALAQGSAAVSRGEALQSKEEAEAARAAARQSAAGAAESRLGLEYYRQQALSERQKNALYVRANQLYTTDVSTAKKNYEAAKLLNPKLPEPKWPTFDEWMQSRGMGALTFGGAAPKKPQSQQSQEDQTSSEGE